MRHTRLYRDGVLEANDFPAAQISDYRQESGTVVWLDLCEPDQADLELVSEEFGRQEAPRTRFDVLCSHAGTVSAMHDAEHRALQGRVTGFPVG
jgi:hypothetical protein